MLLPLLPFILAILSAAAWLVIARRGQAHLARQFGLGANALALLAVLLLPTKTVVVSTGMIQPGLILSWDRMSRWEGAILMLAALAHQATPREERRVVPEELLVAMALLCLAAGDALTAALTVGLLCIAIVWVEGSLPSGSRSPFAMFGLIGILAALGLLSLAAAQSLQPGKVAVLPFWVVSAAAFALGFGGLLLGYPALRWPTMAALTVTAAHLLQRLNSGAALLPNVTTLLLVVGGLAVLFSGISTALWGPRGRALDALYSLAFGLALLAAVLYADVGADTAALALLGAVVAYSALVALERAEGHGWYALPRIIAVALLAGLVPGALLVVRWRVLAATLALGDGWLVLWQTLGALLGCWIAALLAVPWARQMDRPSPPGDWPAWGLGALLVVLALLLGIAPAIFGSNLGWFGAPPQYGTVGLALALLPAFVGIGLALWPAAIRAHARANNWRELLRPVWQGSWESVALWLDHAQQATAQQLYRLLHLLEERLLIVWGLLWVLALLLIALESGL